MFKKKKPVNTPPGTPPCPNGPDCEMCKAIAEQENRDRYQKAFDASVPVTDIGPVGTALNYSSLMAAYNRLFSQPQPYSGVNYTYRPSGSPAAQLTSAGWQYLSSAGEPPIPPKPEITLEELDAQELSTELLYGWRVFSLLKDYRLKGSHGAQWDSKALTAVCGAANRVPGAEACRKHLAEGAYCECGIYSHKNMPEYLSIEATRCSLDLRYAGAISDDDAPRVVASSLSSGIVQAYEYGYRAEKCTIERLWLVRPRKCRAGHWQRLNKDTLAWTCQDIEDHAEVAAMSLSLNYEVPCAVVDVLKFAAELEDSDGSR